MNRLCIIFSCVLLTTTLSLAAAPSDVQEKIRALEQQLQNLRQLKASQDRSQALRETKCYQAVPSRAFCACLSTRLPAEVSFDQYVSLVGAGTQQSLELSAIRDACAGELAH